jgi:hypothetical protein
MYGLRPEQEWKAFDAYKAPWESEAFAQGWQS